MHRYSHALPLPCTATPMHRHSHAPLLPCTATPMHRHSHAHLPPTHPHSRAPLLPRIATPVHRHSRAPPLRRCNALLPRSHATVPRLILIPIAFKISYFPGGGGGQIWPALNNHGRLTTILTKLYMMQVSDVLKVW